MQQTSSSNSFAAVAEHTELGETDRETKELAFCFMCCRLFLCFISLGFSSEPFPRIRACCPLWEDVVSHHWSVLLPLHHRSFDSWYSALDGRAVDNFVLTCICWAFVCLCGGCVQFKHLLLCTILGFQNRISKISKPANSTVELIETLFFG